MCRHRWLAAILVLALPPVLRAQSHCTSSEDVLWSCASRTKTFEVCASKDLAPDRGYVQYRAGVAGRPELVVPAQASHPKGVFSFMLLAQGARLSFTNGEVEYQLLEPLKGSTTIHVARAGGPSRLAVTCLQSSDTLTLTSTIERFKALGIARP